MRRIGRLSVVTVVLGCLAIAQADARGAGGTAGRGGTGVIAFHPHPAARGTRGSFLRSPGFANNRPIRRVALGPLRQHHLPRTFRIALPVWWGGIWPGYVYDGSSGNGYQPALAQETPPPQPQVIVISAENKMHPAAADTMPDYSYVHGCHAIANGYHCELSDAAH